MIASEASDLLNRCAMFDNRKPSLVASKAWAKALHDVPLDEDTYSAVDRFYGTPPARAGERLWIQPHDVRSHRLAIRRERLGETLPAYEPPALPETGAQFIARRRSQLDAVATGLFPAESVGELTGGPAREVARRLRSMGEIGRSVPDEGAEDPAQAVRRAGPLGQHCPECQAPIGRPCRRGPLGKTRKRIHLARHDAARAELGLPPLPRGEDDDIARRKAASAAALAALPPGTVTEPADGFRRDQSGAAL